MCWGLFCAPVCALENVPCVLEENACSGVWMQYHERLSQVLLVYLYHLPSLPSYCFSGRSVRWCQWGVKSPIVVFPSISPLCLLVLFYVFGCSCFRRIYVDECEILLWWFFYQYLVSFFIFLYGLSFEVYFVWYEYCDFCFLVMYIRVEYLFHSLSLNLCMPFVLRSVS